MGKLRLYGSALLVSFVAACGTGNATLTPGSAVSTQGGAPNQPDMGTPQGGGSANANGTPPQASSDAGAATLNGTIGAISFTPTNAIFAFGPGPDGVNQLAIKISDQADDCAVVTAQAHRQGAKSLWMRIRGISMDTPTVALGDATGPTAPQAYAEFYPLDSNCVGTLPAAQAGSKSGTVNLQVGDPNSIATGQFFLTMGTQGDQVAGTFAAAPCPGLLGVVANPALVRTCE